MQRNREHPPQLDMTVEGDFITPPKPPIASRILFWAVVVAVIAGGLSAAALALSFVLFILPVALIAGVIAYGAFRFQLWRARSAARRQHMRHDLWRP
jgi:hypothetical protein